MNGGSHSLSTLVSLVPYSLLSILLSGREAGNPALRANLTDPEERRMKGDKEVTTLWTEFTRLWSLSLRFASLAPIPVLSSLRSVVREWTERMTVRHARSIKGTKRPRPRSFLAPFPRPPASPHPTLPSFPRFTVTCSATLRVWPLLTVASRYASEWRKEWKEKGSGRSGNNHCQRILFFYLIIYTP